MKSVGLSIENINIDDEGCSLRIEPEIEKE